MSPYGRGHVRLVPPAPDPCPVCQEQPAAPGSFLCEPCAAVHRVVMLTCDVCGALTPTAELDAGGVCVMCHARALRSGEVSE